MKLIIPAPIERRLNAYVQAVDGEIAGMGKIEVRDDGNMWVMDIAIYEQVVTAGTADLSPASIAKFQTELVKKGESPKNWTLWWHSHSHFGAFFSITDTTTIAQSTEYDHMVSLVVNKRRERECRVDYHRPFPMYLTDVEVEVPTMVNPRIIEIDSAIEDLQLEKMTLEHTPIKDQDAITEIKEEVEAKVKNKVWARPIGFGHKDTKQADWINNPRDEKWSKNRKKNGTVTTPGEILKGGRLSENDILLLIEQTQDLIKGHEASGNGASVECEELRVDLEGWYEQLYDLDDNNLIKINGVPSYWNGYCYEPIPNRDEFEETLPLPYE